MVSCKGRDDTVNTQTGARNLVDVNIHFEPDLILRNPRETTRHWSLYVEPHGKLRGISLFASEKADSSRIIKRSLRVMWESSLFSVVFLHVFDIAHFVCTRRDATASGTMHNLSRIDKAFSKTHSSLLLISKSISRKLENGLFMSFSSCVRHRAAEEPTKLLTASTAAGHRHRHLGAFMHRCEVWQPVGKYFDHRIS